MSSLLWSVYFSTLLLNVFSALKGNYFNIYIRFTRVCSHVEVLNFSDRVYGIISLERLFPSSIADTMN